MDQKTPGIEIIPKEEIMQKIKEKKESGGKLEIFYDFKKNFFMARPHGIINPSLLKEDLEKARHFANECNRPWTYITNTENLLIANPLNLLYLKEVKKIKNLKQIAVYAPGIINQMLLRLASFIVKPNKIFTNKIEFQKFVENLS